MMMTMDMPRVCGKYTNARSAKKKKK